MDISGKDTQFDEPTTVLSEILSSDRHRAGFTLSIQGFREVYFDIQKIHPGTPVDIVLNGDWAMAQFTRISNQRIRIFPTSTIMSHIYNSRLLSEDDFDFASLHATFYGARRPLSFFSFLREEFASHPFIILVVFSVSFLIFFLIADNINTAKLIPINELIITSATLFLSIFLLFTVSQNIEKLHNLSFFANGLTYRFFAIDRYVAILALLALLTSFLNVVLVLISPDQKWTIFSHEIQTPDSFILSILTALLTSIATTLLVDSFLALVNYYFFRVRYLIEQELTRQLLDSVMEQRNSETV